MKTKCKWHYYEEKSKVWVLGSWWRLVCLLYNYTLWVCKHLSFTSTGSILVFLKHYSQHILLTLVGCGHHTSSSSTISQVFSPEKTSPHFAEGRTWRHIVNRSVVKEDHSSGLILYFRNSSFDISASHAGESHAGELWNSLN